MAEAADTKRRFRRISTAGIFFQGGAAAANLATEPQRQRALRRLQGFIDDFGVLAREDG